jgi:hypothetical protein
MNRTTRWNDGETDAFLLLLLLLFSFHKHSTTALLFDRLIPRYSLLVSCSTHIIISTTTAATSPLQSAPPQPTQHSLHHPHRPRKPENHVARCLPRMLGEKLTMLCVSEIVSASVCRSGVCRSGSVFPRLRSVGGVSGVCVRRRKLVGRRGGVFSDLA